MDNLNLSNVQDSKELSIVGQITSQSSTSFGLLDENYIQSNYYRF